MGSRGRSRDWYGPPFSLADYSDLRLISRGITTEELISYRVGKVTGLMNRLQTKIDVQVVNSFVLN